MEKIEKIYRENVKYIIPLIVVVAICAKLIQHLYLPEKYYFDNNRILRMINDPKFYARWPNSYEIAANFFKSINIFHFTTMLEWSLFLGLIFNSLFIMLFLKNKGLDLKQIIFALMCTGILNIYIYNVGKDSIQLLFFILLFIVIHLNISKILKVIGCFAILYWEGSFYRKYYTIIAFLFLAVMFGVCWLRRNHKKINLKNGILILLTLYVIVYAFLGVSSVIVPKDYNEVMLCKEKTTQLGADTTIDDKIEHKGKLPLFMENYFINSIRMAFPLELLKGGIFYVPFVAFEIFLIYYLVKIISNLYKMDFSQVLALSIFVAYFMNSVLFEPDFGSFVRHEAATFPILYILIFNRDNWNVRAINYHKEGDKRIHERAY